MADTEDVETYDDAVAGPSGGAATAPDTYCEAIDDLQGRHH